MLTPKKHSSGFTIVELLVVIIVIAVLALIAITTYNGVQTKAKNAKTVVAVKAWVKAINLYHADTGSWPYSSCLGAGDTYDGNGQCYPDPYWDVKSAFISALKPYLGNGSIPEPDTTDIGSGKRGALFQAGVPGVHLMQSSVNSCPSIGGLKFLGAGTYAGGLDCRYELTS